MTINRIIPVFCFLLISFFSHAQTTNTASGVDSTEKPAEFPGGDVALMKWVKQHIQYPKDAERDETEGRVFIKCVIDTDGSVTNIEVKKGVHPSLDKEAIRVVSSLPKFKPAIQQGHPVKVYFNFPVIFKLP